tara:strand:+ start:274 stop:912 length:639 start_codon:yes stop_codon:yes gene_type:complete
VSNYPDQYLNLFTPPPVAITYWDGDLFYLENEIKKYEFEKNTSNSISTSNRLLDDPPFVDLRKYIHAFVQRYTEKVFRTKQKIDLMQSWVNITNNGESHPKHYHPNSYMSGVMFIKSAPDSPPLILENHIRPHQLFVDLLDGGNDDLKPNEFKSCISPVEQISPLQGTIVLFPSPTPHLVPKSSSKEERITLAFNTWPARPFGSDKDVTYVY